MGAASSVGAGEMAELFPGREKSESWLNAEDIVDLPQAKMEISRLRKLAESFVRQSSQSTAASSSSSSAPPSSSSPTTPPPSPPPFEAVPVGSEVVNPGGSAVKTGTIARARAAVIDKNVPRNSGKYEKKTVSKDKSVCDMIGKIMDTNVLFKHCKREEKAEIMDAFDVVSFEAGIHVITQGDNGDNFYIVEEGSLDVRLDGIGKVGIPLTSGCSFGELALMYNTPRAATIVTAAKCTLWFIDRALFRTIVTHFHLMRTNKYVNFLAGVQFGAKGNGNGSELSMDEDLPITLGDMLSKYQLEKIAGLLESEVFEQGEFIIRQGQEGDYFYIVEEGEVGIYKDPKLSPTSSKANVVELWEKAAVLEGEEAKEENRARMSKSTHEKLAVLGVGAYFGEKALIKEDKRQASCVAESKTVKCLTLAREDFVMMIGRYDVDDPTRKTTITIK